MANNSQLQFQLKITTLELVTKTDTTATDYLARIIDVFDIDSTSIEYRAEGNANIVLALPRTCQVLRLPKYLRSKQNICHSTAKEYLRAERIFYVYAYISRVSALFGQNLSSQPNLVRIKFHNVNAFNEWLYNRRPSHRINHSKNDDFQFEYGLLYHDACSIPNELLHSNDTIVFAVEIKPKQGWNICRKSDSLLQLLGIGKNVRTKCRFCAMQYLKLKGHSVHGISKYCPMDLYSGVTQRMERALRNLIDSPQNNFRLFINGKLVYTDGNRIEDLHMILNRHFGSEQRSSMDDLISLLINILRYDFVNKRATELHQLPSDQTSICAEAIPCQLPNNSILNYVLKLQLLAQETISHVAEMYSNAPTSFTKLITDEHWPHSHVNELSEKLKHFNWCQTTEVNYNLLRTEFQMKDEEIYEIGATALDSSIMLTFRQFEQNIPTDLPVIAVNEKNFLINASVFDLDPKLYPKHFLKYIEKTRESYDAYKRSM